MEIVLATWNPRKIKMLMEGLMELPIQTRALFSLKLLENLKHVYNPPLRDARFMSVIVIRFPDGSSSVTYGELEGRIAFSPRGELASGYSRIFELPSGLTIAENGLPTIEINDHHRQTLANATECIREWLIAHEARGVSVD